VKKLPPRSVEDDVLDYIIHLAGVEDSGSEI
jgi:hypothetical protein